MNPPMEKICIVCQREFPRHITECPDDLVKLSEKDVRIGTVFDGKYEVLDFIGAGGISRVYKARHKGLNRIVALKILKVAEQVDLQRFRLEAVSVGKLEHPNIARIYAFGVSGEGNPYMAMEYLDGRDLSEWLVKEGPLTVSAAINVYDQVAAALAQAHASKIIHRDIKPNNIVLVSSPDDTDSVKVVDFGMAKLQIEGNSTYQKLTREGEILGTRRYISPEQYHGAPPDERADIFALGVSLHESVLKEGKIPDQLRSVISRATQADPNLRYQSINELREELSKIRETLPPQPAAQGTPEAAKAGSADAFGTFYFWTMLTGMLIVGACAFVAVKQRLDALEQTEQKQAKSATHHLKAPLSLAATDSQARVLLEHGEISAAKQLFRNWIEHNKNSQDWKERLKAYRLEAVFLAGCEDFKAAEVSTRLGLALAEKHMLEKTDEDYLALLRHLACLKLVTGKTEESLELNKQVLELTKGQNSRTELEAKIHAGYDTARVLSSTGKSEQAEKYLRDALAECQENFGSVSSPYGEGAEQLAELLAEQNKLKEARDYSEKAIKCLNLNGITYNITALNTMAFGAELSMKAGERSKVEESYNTICRRYDRRAFYPKSMLQKFKRSMSRLAEYLGKDTKNWQ